jgi:hypothetical protein
MEINDFLILLKDTKYYYPAVHEATVSKTIFQPTKRRLLPPTAYIQQHASSVSKAPLNPAYNLIL